MYKPILPIVFFFMIFYTSQAIGQDRNADSVHFHETQLTLINSYNKAIGKQSRLYNGPDFSPYLFQSVTNANFLDSTKFAAGTVNYDGIVYANVPLIYNIHKDLVLSLLYNRLFTYSLVSDEVASFDMLGHHFINVWPDSLNKQMEAGFYNEVYHGKLQVLGRYVKTLQNENTGPTIDKVFIEKDTYYLKKGKAYYNVTKSGDFYKVLADKKKELKKYLNDKNINFNHNKEQAMALLAAYYDKLTN